MSDIKQLYEWASEHLTDLQVAQRIRKERGIKYPQSIELQLRNLKDAYYKIALDCQDQIDKTEGKNNLSLSEIASTKLSPEEEEFAKRLNKKSNANLDWTSANPHFKSEPY